RSQRGQVEPELGQKVGACFGDLGGFIARHDVFARCEKIRQVNTEATGEMVVANSGRAKLSCLPGQWSVSRSVLDCYCHDAVEHLDDFGRCEAKITVPAIPYWGQQSHLGELCQMAAGRLRGDPRREGKLAGG